MLRQLPLINFCRRWSLLVKPGRKVRCTWLDQQRRGRPPLTTAPGVKQAEAERKRAVYRRIGLASQPTRST